MKIAIFPGCKIPYYLPQYGMATRTVLETLGIEIIDLEFNCCGYPTRALDAEAYLYSAARNFALAEAAGLDIVTPCKCCFGSLKHARYWLDGESSAKQIVDNRLAGEGLGWQGRSDVKHLLSFLADDVGVENIANHVKRPFNDLKIATHYGCHALRPSQVTGFDDPLAPTLFERLIHITGASCIEWEQRLNCCGNPLWEKNPALSVDLMNRKLEDARAAGADYLCTACTYCQIQFDTVQHDQLPSGNASTQLASILYPQLLGLSLGLEPSVLQLDLNQLDITEVGEHLAEP